MDRQPVRHRRAEQAQGARVPIFYTLNRLASGLSAYLGYHSWKDCRRLGPDTQGGFAEALGMDKGQQQALDRLLLSKDYLSLSEHESKQRAAAWGIPSSGEALAATAEDAAAAARGLGYQVALKADSPGILHKTEAGVIRLELDSDAEVREAFAQVMSRAEAYLTGMKGLPINGVLVQEMVSGGVEVIVGVSYDQQLGPVLLFGTRRIMVDLYNDVALRLCPISLSEAHEMIAEVRGSKLLQGFRGRPPADLDALGDALVRASNLVVNLEGSLSELDINPLMVLPAGQGVKAVDALAVLKK